MNADELTLSLVRTASLELFAGALELEAENVGEAAAMLKQVQEDLEVIQARLAARGPRRRHGAGDRAPRGHRTPQAQES